MAQKGEGRGWGREEERNEKGREGRVLPAFAAHEPVDSTFAEWIRFSMEVTALQCDGT